MNLREAQTLARTAMDAHGLHDWSFGFNRRKGAFGICRYRHKRIELSAILTEHGDRAQVIQTIGHEIAHALAGQGTGHGPIWKAQMRAMGLTPDRCGETNEQQQIALRSVSKYVVTCSVSGKQIATMDRLIKQRRTRYGTRTYSGHSCRCHDKPALYNGKTWQDVT